jgi:hypothetical protein
MADIKNIRVHDRRTGAPRVPHSSRSHAGRRSSPAGALYFYCCLQWPLAGRTKPRAQLAGQERRSVWA